MKNRILFIAAFLSIGFLLLSASSCKDRRAAKTSEPFDPSIDGIAVRSLPSMDIELAKRIKQKGSAVKATERAISEGSGVSSEATEAEKNIEREPTRSDPNS